MNHREQHLADLLLQDALDEVFHGGPPADLAARIVAAAKGDAATEPAPAPLRLVAPSRRPRWRWALEVAAVAGIAALLLLLIAPPGREGTPPAQQPEVPDGVAVSYEASFAADRELRVENGWYCLTDGAPPLVHGAQRVEEVRGKVVVRVGGVPLGAEITAQRAWLGENGIEEEAMLNGTWIKAGALAVCVLAGSAFVDSEFVMAQRAKEPERKQEPERKKEPEKERAKEGEKKVERKDETEARLERLRNLEQEIKDLEERLEEARWLEDERERAARIKRIETALEGKRADLRKLKDRIENERKAAESKEEPKREREADRKEVERKREADRKEVERKEVEKKEAERKREEDRKAREERERKEAEKRRERRR